MIRAGAWLGLLLLFAPSVFAGDLKLWYDHPAGTWMTEALPVGNGRLGAMIFGGVAQEHIQFNESTLWSGGPTESAGNRPGGAEHIGVIQTLLAHRQVDEATKLIQRYLYGDPSKFGSYQTFGDLLIDQHSPADAARATDYRRELDLADGVCRVHYKIDGVAYDRQYFCSRPDQVLVLRFTCGNRDGLHLLLHGAQKWLVEKSKIVLQGKLRDNLLRYQAVAAIRPEGTDAQSRLTPVGIEIFDADAVNIYLAAATDYQPKGPYYRGNDFVSANANAISGVKYRSFDDLLDLHEKDYQSLFQHVTLDLGHSNAEKLPTDQRLIAYHNGAADPGLEALYFQFTRYLLISSSRPYGLPANRQGLWNDNPAAPWGADFPAMMNLEMMYWPVETANLAQCAHPLIDMIDDLRAPGRVTARTIYGARGWVVNYTTNPWGYTAAGTGPYQYFPAAAAWLCQAVWEHYAFNQNKSYLAKTAYPIMKEAAEFWLAHLITDSDGTLVSSPSESPEHGGFVVGATMDQEIIWDLFTNCIAASRALNVDADFRAALQADLHRLSPLKIGRLGQLQEWKADIDHPADTHRHVSHLFALYPGHEIDPLTTPALAAAARKSLELRGDGGIAWGMAWKIAFWARLLDGDRAHAILFHLMTPTTETRRQTTGTGVYANLLTARPPFQMDAACAAAAGMVEMLLQSQNGEIRLLPALPAAWPNGSVTGLRARGGFEVDETWANSHLTTAAIRSLAGGVCRFRCGDAVMELQTSPGDRYEITRDQNQLHARKLQ